MHTCACSPDLHTHQPPSSVSRRHCRVPAKLRSLLSSGHMTAVFKGPGSSHTQVHYEAPAVCLGLSSTLSSTPILTPSTKAKCHAHAKCFPDLPHIISTSGCGSRCQAFAAYEGRKLWRRTMWALNPHCLSPSLGFAFAPPNPLGGTTLFFVSWFPLHNFLCSFRWSMALINGV